MKVKGEKERYTHLNAEFQRIARRDKKAFLRDQCKEIEENIEWERLEIASGKLEIPREHFVKDEHNKGQNGKDLKEAEDLKKRWQEYTEELYKKDHDPDNHNGVITHLEPDSLECKWVLGSITTNKAIGGDEIEVEIFQILKDDAVKVLHSIHQKIWKTQQWPRTGKGQFSFQSQRKAMPKNAQTTAQLHSYHMLAN